MINVEIGNKKYKLKNSFNEITIKEYKKCVEIDKREDILLKYAEIIECLSDIPIDILRDIDIKQLYSLYKQLDYSKKTIKTEPKQQIKIDDTYYVLDKLDEDTNLGIYIDLDSLLRNEEDNKLEKLCSILYREIENGEIKPYDTKSAKHREELFLNHMTVNDVLGAQFFFMMSAIKLQKDTPDFSKKVLNLMKENV